MKRPRHGHTRVPHSRLPRAGWDAAPDRPRPRSVNRRARLGPRGRLLLAASALLSRGLNESPGGRSPIIPSYILGWKQGQFLSVHSACQFGMSVCFLVRTQRSVQERTLSQVATFPVEERRPQGARWLVRVPLRGRGSTETHAWLPNPHSLLRHPLIVLHPRVILQFTEHVCRYDTIKSKSSLTARDITPD